MKILLSPILNLSLVAHSFLKSELIGIGIGMTSKKPTLFLIKISFTDSFGSETRPFRMAFTYGEEHPSSKINSASKVMSLLLLIVAVSFSQV